MTPTVFTATEVLALRLEDSRLYPPSQHRSYATPELEAAVMRWVVARRLMTEADNEIERLALEEQAST